MNTTEQPIEQQAIVQTNEEQEIQVEDIPVFEPEQQGTDLKEFEGNKVNIASISVVDSTSSYGADGRLLAPEAPRTQVKKIRVVTTVVTQLVKADGTNVDIKASELFGMSNKDGMWGISSHEKAGIQKLMKRQKVTKLPELVGTQVTVKATENSNGKVFLGFIKE
jgi:hypothetical protein